MNTILITSGIGNPLSAPLTAFKQAQEVSLNMETFNKDNAQRLYIITQELILISD